MSVLVGKKAPDFTADAILKNNIIQTVNFGEMSKGKYAVLFFYPMDFTFVCPSELIAFSHRLEEFTKRNVEVFSVSIDNPFTHLAWKNTPVEKGGIGQVGYTMVADIKHEISQAYGIEDISGVALRASFLIDRDGIVQHQVVNNLSLGRNIDEMLRMVDALQFTEENGEVCPAGWMKGQSGMKASTEGVAEYLTEHSAHL